MAKIKSQSKPQAKAIFTEDGIDVVIPTVSHSEVPLIRIYDADNSGSFWYRKAGFTAKFNEE